MSIRLKTFLVLWTSLTSTISAELAAHGLTDNPQLFSEQPFDILIAGGGTAGMALAGRLAESTSLNVGVLEAGNFIPPGQHPLVDTPVFVGQSFGDPNLAWGFSTIPQARLDNRALIYPRGKMIGGSSGLNAMAWVRPPREELDIWSRLGISNGWDWDGLLPYMMKIEDVNLGDSSAFPGSKFPSGYDSTVQGRSGPIKIGYDNVFTGVQTPFIESFINVGAVLNENPANGNNIGVFNSQHSVDDATGNRTYAATGYFVPNQDRVNLLVLTGARVARVIFAEAVTPLSATGIEYIVDDTTYTAHASREVVLSAGTIQTPQILELSGIGNKSLLDNLGIKTLLDVPTVGENFQEHNSAPSNYLLKHPAPVTLDALGSDPTFAFQQMEQYLVNHTGFFTHLPTYSYHPLQTFFSPMDVDEVVKETRAELASRNLSPFQKLQAEIQLEWLTNGTVGQIELALFAGGFPGLPNPIIPGRGYASLVAFGQHLFSRGSVHIHSSSPLDAPLIDPNYLDFAFDRKILSLGLEVAARVAAASPLADLIESVANPADVTSAVDLDNYITETMSTEYNSIGTAAMAPKDLGGVVGDDLLVYGTSNLRIADASIIPLHLSTHIQTIVYAIAEKAADIMVEHLVGPDSTEGVDKEEVERLLRVGHLEEL